MQIGKKSEKATANGACPNKVLLTTHAPTSTLEVTLEIEIAPLKSEAKLQDFKATIATTEAPNLHANAPS